MPVWLPWGYNRRVNEYRVTRITGKIPLWRIEHDGASDIALTEEDTMAIIGTWLQQDYEAGKGGEFRILWDGVPLGFKAPSLDEIFNDPPSLSH